MFFDEFHHENYQFFLLQETVAKLIQTLACGFQFEEQQDAYHRRKHESRIRTSTALIPREINMREL